MKSFRVVIVIFVISVTAMSCKKWLDINSDPANPQVGSAEVLLAPIEFQMPNNIANDSRFLFRYIQYFASPSADPVWEKHGYEPASDNAGSIWRMSYVNLGPNLELMIKDGVEKEKWAYAGIGMAIKAWSFQTLTDYHGPVILDQAFDTTRLTFNYQDQPEVYAKVREWAYLALNYLDREGKIDYTAVLAGATGDQIYRGDRAKWKKFVYGLLALHYSHLINKAEFKTAYADSVIKFANLSFADAGDDPTVFFNASNAAESNPFGVNQGLLTNTVTTNLFTGRVTKTIVSMLTGGVRGTPAVDTKTSVDPRLSRMINPGPDSIYRGVIPTYGDPNATKRIPHVLGSVAAPYPGKYLFADKARFPIMSYAQLQFTRAEALFIKNNLPEAYSAYIKGIDGHMDFINRYGLNGNTVAPAITAAQIAAYKASSEVAQNSSALRLSDIMTQKYIAQWGWAGVEQWCDLRKYHYDTAVFKNYYSLSAGELATSNLGKLAYRIRPRYNSEYVWNKNELNKWGGLDVDYHTREMWFSLP
jgi:hypothetical protein